MTESRPGDAQTDPPDGGSQGEWQPRPRPRYNRLALHRWTMGQVLHPAQFDAQEEALLQHIGLRVQLAGLPSYGVALLQWSDEQLAAGELYVSALTVVFPSGLLIDVPGNAVLTNRSLKLPDPPKDRKSVALWLHVRNETRDAGDLAQYTGEEGDPPEVARVIYEVELSTEPTLDNAREPMLLAELAVDAGTWSLGPYIPPLLRVGANVTPFLREVIDRNLESIATFERQLVTRAAQEMTTGSELSEVRRVLAAVYRVRAYLADHGFGAPTRSVALHPYHLFSALRDFYVEMSVFQGKSLESWPIRYQHDNLAESFAEVSTGIARSLQVPTVVSPKLSFERDGYWYITDVFPDALRAAREVFLLLEPGSEPIDAGDVKLASPLRAEEVYTKALEGVPRTSVPSVGFSQTFGGRAMFFSLDTSSEEWKHAVHEGALCFAALPQLEGLTAALFWTEASGG